MPRSGLAKSLISGPRIMFVYSSCETFIPNCRTKGTIVAAEAPPNSSAVTREGRMRKEANSGGNEEADSFSVLHLLSMNRLFAPHHMVSTYRISVTFSASLPKLKLSRPAHTFTNRLLKKNAEPSPAVSAMPVSRNVFGVMRPFGFGLRSFLKEGNTERGIEPRDEG